LEDALSFNSYEYNDEEFLFAFRVTSGEIVLYASLRIERKQVL
jgi:hypothetical protein